MGRDIRLGQILASENSKGFLGCEKGLLVQEKLKKTVPMLVDKKRGWEGRLLEAGKTATPICAESS